MATSNSKIVSFSMGARDRKVTRVSFNVTAVNDVLFSGGCEFDRNIRLSKGEKSKRNVFSISRA